MTVPVSSSLSFFFSDSRFFFPPEGVLLMTAWVKPDNFKNIWESLVLREIQHQTDTDGRQLGWNDAVISMEEKKT